MTEKGDFYWNKEAADLAVAVSRLRELKQSEADPKVFINGDAKAHSPNNIPFCDRSSNDWVHFDSTERKKLIGKVRRKPAM